MAGDPPRDGQTWPQIASVRPCRREPYEPYCLGRMMAMHALPIGDRALAIYTLLCADVYTRLAKPLGLHARDIVPGQDGLGHGMARTRVLLHPCEVGVPSETYEYDRAIVRDLKRQEPLAHALEGAARARPREGLLLELRPGEVGVRMSSLADLLRLDPLGVPHPHRLRHTGASHDFVGGARSLGAIQLCGRWRDARSLRRYQHRARVAELFGRLPTAVQLYARVCAMSLLSGGLPASRPSSSSRPLPAASPISSRRKQGWGCPTMLPARRRTI